MLSDDSPLAFSDELPGVVDVVVVGGGIIGISTAWFLTQHGMRVAVVEKGRVGGEQSRRNWGWIRKHGRDRDELPIVMESIEHWAQIAQEVDEDIGFRREGVLYIASSERELAAREAWLSTASEFSLDTHMLNRDGLRRVLKHSPAHWIGGVYTPSDARAEPFLAVPAIARTLQAKHVAIVEQCAARSIEVAAGEVCGVVTERGTVKCGAVVCAGGAWTSLFLRQFGAGFPQLSVRASVARTAPAAEVFQGCAASSKIAFRRRQDGGYTLAAGGFFDHYISRDSFRYLKPFLANAVRSKSHYSLRLRRRGSSLPTWGTDAASTSSPFERTRVLNPEPAAAAVREIRRQLKRELPSLGDIPLVESWAGLIDATPDLVPVMDRVAAIPGVFVAAGFSGHGFGIGPGAGRLMADMVLGRDLGHDVRRFRFNRFSDGSKLVLGPAI